MKNKNIKYFFPSLCIILLMLSCSSNEYVMPKDKMEDVLYDIQLAQTAFQNGRFDLRTNEQKEAVYEGIFAKHGITKEILDSSLVWYADHIDVLLKTSDKVTNRLKAEEEFYSHLKQEEDQRQGKRTSDFPLYYYLTPENAVYSFNFDSIKVSSLNVSKVNALAFDILGMSPRVILTASVTMEYADTVIVRSDTLKSASVTITFDQPTGRYMKNLSGFVSASVSTPYNYTIQLYNIRLDKDSLNVNRSVDPVLKPVQLSDN